MRQSCLVTGASGFLGAAVAKRLAANYEVTGCCHSSGDTALVECDLRDPNRVRALVSTYHPQFVVHSAAYRDPDFCETNPAEAQRLNVDPVRALRDCLPEETYLLFVSSDYVFSGTHPPYEEDAPCDPVNVYGRTKVEAESLLAERPRTIILRIPVLVGLGDTLEASGYVGQLISAVRNGTERTEDHCHVRFPTWIEDVADVIAFLFEKRFEGRIHFCGPRGATRYESAIDVADVLGMPGDHLHPSTRSVPRTAQRPLNSALSTDKLRSLGYHRFTDLREVVQLAAERFPG